MNLPIWLETESGRLGALLDRGQLPHALLIHGSAGVGRRLLAFRLRDRLLDSAATSPDSSLLCTGRIDEEALVRHPDFRLLQPIEDKKTIGVDQVRELIGFLSLTSHQHGAKVVIIFPAQAMNKEAANCLLKTLEEPAANSYLILVAEAPSRLPPTIVSRCHRVRIPLPDAQQARSWLHDIDPGVDWPHMLELCGGAPLTALGWRQIGFPQLSRDLEQDLLLLRKRADTPAGVARRWAKKEPESCLRWLFNRLGAELRSQLEQQGNESVVKPDNRHLQKSTEMLNMEPSFAVLRQISELRRLHGSGLNAELQLANVLALWYGKAG